ncbi:MAG: DinB family protein [Chloroflexota bacterium]
MSGGIDRDGLLALYAYNAHANKLVLDTAEKMTVEQFTQKSSPSHDSVRGILSHMLECEAYFLAECQGRVLDEEDISSLETICRRWLALEREQVAFIQSLSGAELARIVQLQIRGQQLAFPVWELMTQAMIHSVHHRGELSIVMTGLGYPLPTLDILLHFIKQSGQHWPFE